MARENISKQPAAARVQGVLPARLVREARVNFCDFFWLTFPKMSDNEDADVDINLLSELLEMAENDDKEKTKSAEAEATAPSGKVSAKPQSFDSLLEDLDNIPLKTLPRSKLAIKREVPQLGTEGKNSALHAGDTDSSDDEDARKQGSSLDGFGATVKRMLKSAEEEKRTAPRLTDTKGPPAPGPSWKKQATSLASGTSSLLCLPAKKKTGPMDMYTDPSIGIRIINPLVSSTVIKERLVGRKTVPFSEVKQFTTDGKVTVDWVIFGVIVSKAPPRTSAKGTNYSIIKLSDLRGSEGPKMVSLFLFSSAFKKHGKDSVGTVIGVLNPGIMDNSRNHNDEACLSVDNSDRVMVLGTSKDFGMCKSKKKNGENCTAIVNLAQCEYCIYHVKQEYQKCSRRSDIQSSFNGPGLNNLRNKVLGKNEVFYGGQSFSAVPAKKNQKLVQKDETRLRALFGSPSSQSPKLKPAAKTGLATSVELSYRQSKKDLDRLRKLTADDGALSDQSSGVVTAQYNPDETKPDEAKLAALALIAKKKSSEDTTSQPCKKAEESHLSTLDDIKELSGSSVVKDAAIMSESVPTSRGVAATMALNKRKNTGGVTASSLGLGLSPKSESSKETSRVLSPKLSEAVPSKANNKTQLLEKSSKASSGLKSVNSKNSSESNSASLSSDQLRKLAQGGIDFESRMLRQAAQQAAFNEEASKANPNTTPSMLGLGRYSASLPKLGKGLSPFSTVDLTAPISRKISNSAKLNAINLIKNKGGISKKDPNHREFESRKKSTKENQTVKRPREEVSSPITNAEKKLKQSPPQDDAEARKARFKELMEATSRHTHLVEAAENDAQETYFGKLEKKEQMEEKMLNTFKIACKAVRCLTCKYTSFSASDKCKEEKHPLKVMDAMKRFFKCADCGNRTVSLNIIPLVSCSNCKSSRWERTAMIRERRVGISQETLSVRGMEETFIGSVTTGANVNLLVPETGT
ncbi:hypothetical protein ONE63_002966 [Megalurothrips usitatus]|uniref:Protein MCM10 homolog n=1 Tax=Megalurothrips usitatus TaxID=439358 RepID=A0AAV7XA27_9NEOP|nr:hypothetical protein ONE63_002966 [Megalurothrips usitatus]